MASIVYVLSNGGMPGLLKIGRTGRDDPSERMGELYTTAVPFPFECVMAMELDDDEQALQLERALHKTFEPARPNPNREFFRVAEEQALAILKIWPGGKDVTYRGQKEVEGKPVERAAIEQSKMRRANLDFAALGIGPGERLVFFGAGAESETPDALEAEVVDDRRVRFQGEEMSLTRATKKSVRETG